MFKINISQILVENDERYYYKIEWVGLLDTMYLNSYFLSHKMQLFFLFINIFKTSSVCGCMHSNPYASQITDTVWDNIAFPPPLASEIMHICQEIKLLERFKKGLKKKLKLICCLEWGSNAWFQAENKVRCERFTNSKGIN